VLDLDLGVEEERVREPVADVEDRAEEIERIGLARGLIQPERFPE